MSKKCGFSGGDSGLNLHLRGVLQALHLDCMSPCFHFRKFEEDTSGKYERRVCEVYKVSDKASGQALPHTFLKHVLYTSVNKT